MYTLYIIACFFIGFYFDYIIAFACNMYHCAKRRFKR